MKLQAQRSKINVNSEAQQFIKARKKCFPMFAMLSFAVFQDTKVRFPSFPGAAVAGASSSTAIVAW